MSQNKRADYLKKQDIFYHFGQDVKWASKTIPAEPFLVSIGNNVKIAAGVTFITHDIIGSTLTLDPEVKKTTRRGGKLPVSYGENYCWRFCNDWGQFNNYV